jgi:hypothetical protein
MLSFLGEITGGVDTGSEGPCNVTATVLPISNSPDHEHKVKILLVGEMPPNSLGTLGGAVAIKTKTWYNDATKTEEDE